MDGNGNTSPRSTVSSPTKSTRKISTANVVTRTVSGDDIRSDNDSFSSPSPSEDRRSRSSSEAKSFGRAIDYPPKPKKEEVLHKKQYDKMMKDYERKVEHDRKVEEARHRNKVEREERIVRNARKWKEDILPNYQAWFIKPYRSKLRDLYWDGVPSVVRPRVWQLALGNDLHISKELYRILLEQARTRITTASETIRAASIMPSHAHKSHDDIRPCDSDAIAIAGSISLIPLDLPRTFPMLSFFHSDGPMHDSLKNVLEAYVAQRPDVGYVQGMPFPAAMLLLNMDESDAFVSLSNLLHLSIIHSYYTMNDKKVSLISDTFNSLLKDHLPRIYDHFINIHLSTDMYLMDCLPLECACRVWDVLMFEGQSMLFRTALADLEDSVTRLIHMPGDSSIADDLMCTIADVEIHDMDRCISILQRDLDLCT